VTSLAGVADPQKCVKATSPGVQSVGTYLVAELELGAHAQGAMLHGLLINPTALTLESVQYSVVPFVNPETVNPDAPAPSESKLSVLQKIPPGAGAAFSVLLPGVQPASVRAVCFEFESATYTYGVVASRRRPQ